MNDTNIQTIYVELPATSSPTKPKLLTGLGKATKRGIKKCYKCGYYNGNRGLQCKNTQCNTIFKECTTDKHKLHFDAVKLITGICRQLYSVRVRDHDPDYRGFVQLPLLHSATQAHKIMPNEESYLSKVALCFVETCQRLFDDTILKCHETESKPNSLLCVHISSALKSQNMATVMELRRDVLNLFKISTEIKEKLWQLKEEVGPLVQRISHTTMAVKCQVTPKHPLGYLHFYFTSSNKSRVFFDNYHCSCSEFVTETTKDKSNDNPMKCLHYYACIWALASDSKLSEEFEYLLNCELPKKTTISNSYNCGNINEKKLIKEKLLEQQIVTKHRLSQQWKLNQEIINKRHSKRHRSNKIKTKLSPKIVPVHIRVLNPENDSNQNPNLNSEIISRSTESEISWKFTDWLSFVTESINQTMQFDNCGILNNLIFHIPQTFYEEFRKRIPAIYSENVHSLLSYGRVFYIMNILHLKAIFDTPKIKLRISKRFKHDQLKGYVEYNEEEEINHSFQSNFIFFLNVGQSTVDESDNTNNSFIIEWIPNITNDTKIGQLKFQYKYGRKST